MLKVLQVWSDPFSSWMVYKMTKAGVFEYLVGCVRFSFISVEAKSWLWKRLWMAFFVKCINSFFGEPELAFYTWFCFFSRTRIERCKCFCFIRYCSKCDCLTVVCHIVWLLILIMMVILVPFLWCCHRGIHSVHLVVNVDVARSYLKTKPTILGCEVIPPDCCRRHSSALYIYSASLCVASDAY